VLWDHIPEQILRHFIYGPPRNKKYKEKVKGTHNKEINIFLIVKLSDAITHFFVFRLAKGYLLHDIAEIKLRI